jgi:hypothetical protein
VNDFVSRGFRGRRRAPADVAARLPPGQYDEPGFPVLTAGPTPRVPQGSWTFRIDGMVAAQREWSWDEFARLRFETVPCDIHCVTSWSKLGTSFGGVSLDVLLEQAEPLGAYAMRLAYSVRSAEELIYADELGDDAVVTFTREPPAGWGGHTGRIDAPMIADAARDGTTAFICGTHGFVETAARLAMDAGVREQAIRTERFGPTG